MLECMTIKSYKNVRMHDYKRVIKMLECMTIKEL